VNGTYIPRSVSIGERRDIPIPGMEVGVARVRERVGVECGTRGRGRRRMWMGLYGP